MPYQLKRLLHTIAELKKVKTIVTMKTLCGYNPQEVRHLMVLRCDIERNLPHALFCAQKTHELGIPCTMYFHTRSGCYDPEIFAVIRDLGHEIGYHHECLDRCQGDFEAAQELFLREVERFRKDGFPVTTVCSHGEGGLPKNGYECNWELFERYPDLLEKAGVAAEVYTTIKDRWHPIYASDTLTSYRHFWCTIGTGSRRSELLQILVHPHRWHNSFLPAGREVAKDLLQTFKNKIRKSRTYNTISS